MRFMSTLRELVLRLHYSHQAPFVLCCVCRLFILQETVQEPGADQGNPGGQEEAV